MGKRRNNLIILTLVLGLLAASIYVITDKKTVLGLDLQGGTELVYQARPTPQEAAMLNPGEPVTVRPVEESPSS